MKRQYPYRRKRFADKGMRQISLPFQYAEQSGFREIDPFFQMGYNLHRCLESYDVQISNATVLKPFTRKTGLLLVGLVAFLF